MASRVNVSSSTVGVASVGDGIVNIGRDLVVGSYLEESYEELDLPRESKVFKGRDEDLVKLEALFFQDGNRKVVIFGLPGFGKTELAKQFAKRCTDTTKIDKAFWINAETSENLKERQTTVKKAYKFFKDKRCLFIFDNGISRRSIAMYEPPEIGNFFLLITSQIADWGDDIKQMSLKPLNVEASIDVFREILGVRYQTDEEKIYKEMSKFVSNAPLGLIVIAGHLRSKMDACKQKEFKTSHFLEKISAMLKKKIHYSLSTPYERSLYAAMAVCLDRMLKEDFVESDQTRELSEKLLCICAYLNPEYIHIKEIKEIMECSEEITMDECLYLSENFSFIEYYNGFIKIHRLCQMILKLYFDEIKKDCYSACVRWLLRQEYGYIFRQHQHTILMEADDNKEIINEIVQQNASKNDYVEKILTVLAQYGCCKCCELIFQNITPDEMKLHVNKLLSKYCEIYFNFLDGKCNVDIVRMLLEKGGDVNARDNLGCTPLHWASQCQNIDVVRMLLDKGGDIHARDSDGCTPLHWASQGRNANIVQFLLEIGVDVHAQDNRDRTPLHFASGNGNVDIVQMLLQKEVNVHAQDSEGRTPLHFASVNGNVDIVQMLLKKEVDVHARDNEGRTSLHWASEGWNENVVRMLLESGADVHAQDNKGRTPLHWAVHRYFGNFSIVQVLLEKGGDVNARDSDNCTPLHKAASQENVDIVPMMLERGDVNARDNTGRTPLHYASSNRNVDIVQLLLEKEVDVHARDNEGRTPLHWAHQGGDVNKVRMLLERGVDVNVQDNKGRTPLHFASSAGNVGMVRMLLEKEVDVNAKDNGGRTPLHLASWQINDYVDVHQMLLEKGGDVHARDNEGRTPLHLAGLKMNLYAVRILIENGGDINARDSEGRTPRIRDWKFIDFLPVIR